jgi:folate-dependent phosphoribosylglycinamide formyltransferase PurN
MKILIIAPTNFQSYANSLFIKLLENPEVQVVGVVVHAFNFSRLRNEFKRDGKRIFHKVLNKFILGEKKSLEYDFVTPKRFLVQTGIKADLKLLCDLNNIYYNEVSSFNNLSLIEDLTALKIDIGAFCGGGLLRDNFLNSFSFGVLNCHMGVLPKYRGMDVVEWPFLEKDIKQVGVTCHLMDKGIDTGDIIEIKKVDSNEFKNFIELREYMSGVMLELMVKNILSISKGNFKKYKQLQSDGRQYFVMHPILKKIAEKIYSK